MFKQVVVIIKDQYTEEVVLFDELHDSIPFIKSTLLQLNIYDDEYQASVNGLVSIEDVREFLDNNNIQEVAVYLVTKINPREICI